MNSVAFKMLIGNKAAFIGAIFGVFLSVLLISQQAAIFLGLVSRSYRIVSDISLPNLWVIDPASQGEDQLRGMPPEYIEYVKNIPGVEWAVPINYLPIPLATSTGMFKFAEVYGVDDITLMGAPKLIEGKIENLRRDEGVVIDAKGAKALTTVTPEGNRRELKVGDALEINGHRAVIVGIGETSAGFYPQPIIFVTNSQFQKYTGSNSLQYIALKTKKGADEKQILNKINSHKNLLGLTRDALATRIRDHFLKTGILINFGLSVVLGLIIGFSITGQIFYIMTMNNLKYYALIKALGGSKEMILKMILVQAFIVGIIGYILGTGITLLWGFAIKQTILAFEFPWQLLVFTALLALIICIFSVLLSVQKVFKLDPQIMMNV